MKKRTISIIAILLVMASICQIMLVGCEKNTTSDGKENPTGEPSEQTGDPGAGNDLVISEALASGGVYLDAYGENSDWIELYNPTGSAISLAGYSLSDDREDLGKYPLPDGVIKAKSYLLVIASGKNAVAVTGEIHTGFKISAGERITLSKNGQIVDTLILPPDLPDSVSYGLLKDADGYTKVYFSSPTPGSENKGPSAETLSGLTLPDTGLRINEFMMKNVAVLFDEDGDCPDWVEIYNSSDKPIDLSGYGLSDKFSNPQKWKFPNVTIGAKEYLVVLLSGKEKTYLPGSSTYLHASFKLNDDDDGLILSGPGGSPIDRIATVALPENVSYGRDPQDLATWKFYSKATPGRENSTAGFESLELYLATQTEKVYINEVCAVSSSTVEGLPGEDWIELYNNTAEAIDLEGWSLSKYISDLKFYTFPSVTIPSHGYLVVNADGNASTDPKKLSTGFKIKFSGNTLYLTDPEGYLTDSFETGYQRAGVTSGRVIEGQKLTRRFFVTPSKKEANILPGSAVSYAQPAVIESDQKGLNAKYHTITITTLTKNASIYYTTDGTLPTVTSFRYSAPLTVTKSTSVRAVVYADGLLPSDVSTKTFLCDDPHELGVVCLTTSPDNLFGYTTGIWADGPGWTEKSPHKGANYWMDWERPVYFEYYEKDGKEGVSFAAGIKNHGQYSRAQDQKSVSINLKEAYGSSTCNYPFFGEDDVSTFDNLLLRTGSQDWNYTNLMDAYCARVVRGQMDLDLMRDLPVAVYVNGEYWGLYYIRDKINESYIKYTRGIEEDNLDMIKGTTRAETGDYAAHKALIEYIKTHDLSNQTYFDYVASQIDLEEWSNYWITETFFANTDTGNIRFYCTRDGSGKWRWILFDLDWALYTSTYKWNMIEEFINPKGHGVGHSFSTVIAIGLFKNKAFKEQFVRRYADYMHTMFSVQHLHAVLDDMVAEIAPEMPRQCARWGALTMTKWESNINKVKDIIAYRWDKSVLDLKNTFNLSNEMMAELFPEKYS